MCYMRHYHEYCPFQCVNGMSVSICLQMFCCDSEREAQQQFKLVHNASPLRQPKLTVISIIQSPLHKAEAKVVEANEQQFTGNV